MVKHRYYLIFGIIVLIGIVLISGCVKEQPTQAIDRTILIFKLKDDYYLHNVIGRSENGWIDFDCPRSLLSSLKLENEYYLIKYNLVKGGAYFEKRGWPPSVDDILVFDYAYKDWHNLHGQCETEGINELRSQVDVLGNPFKVVYVCDEDELEIDLDSIRKDINIFEDYIKYMNKEQEFNEKARDVMIKRRLDTFLKGDVSREDFAYYHYGGYEVFFNPIIKEGKLDQYCKKVYDCEFVCCSDLECVDNERMGQDICLNPGTKNARCEHTKELKEEIEIIISG